MNWIFSSFKKDLFLLVLPGHICLTLLAFLNYIDFSFGSSFISLGVLIFIDNGHVYTTFLKKIRQKLKSEDRNKLILYISIYFICSISIQSYSILFFWKFALYATFFHYIKQNIGFLRFYEKLNFYKDRSNINQRILLSFQVLAAIGLHFRPNMEIEYYSQNDLFSYPNIILFELTKILYICLFIFWIYKSMKDARQSLFFWNSFIFVTSCSGLFYYLLLGSFPILYVLVALIASHGIPYLMLINKSLLFKFSKKYSALTLTGVVIGVAIIFGLLENLIEDQIIVFTEKSGTFQTYLINAIFLLPLFTHFFCDSFLWKGNNYKAKEIIKAQI